MRMPLIAPVPQKHFSGARRITDDTPRSLVSILNELIDAVNAGGTTAIDHLKVQIDHTHWGGAPVLLGQCPAGRIAAVCVVEVLVPFDGGAQLTVGDVAAQGRLQSGSQNYLGSSDLFVSEPHWEYSGLEDLFVFFPAGSPSTGSGQVTVYLS